MTEKKKEGQNEQMANKEQERLDVCQKAPEYAEHHRLQDDDMPCKDGRAGEGGGDE